MNSADHRIGQQVVKMVISYKIKDSIPAQRRKEARIETRFYQDAPLGVYSPAGGPAILALKNRNPKITFSVQSDVLLLS